jgi:hypothetical protein
VAIALLPVVASAQPRTDVVRLANGDRVTGEIMKLDRGRLELKTDDAGTIVFEWDNIASVESTRQFEIATTDGRRMLGSLQPAVGRIIRIMESDGDTTLPMPEITTIHPIGASFFAKVDGSINMGFNYTRSSAIGQLTLNMHTTFRKPAFVVQLSISGVLTDQPEGGADDRGALKLGYVRYRENRWFVSGAGSFENNESLGLVLRSQVGAMVGQRLVNTNRATFEAGGGMVVNNEESVDAETTQNLEAVATLRSSFFTYDGSKTNFAMTFEYFPSLSNWGRQRLQFDLKLAQDVWKDFSFSIDVFDTFDSAPPDPDAARNDMGIVASVGWTY